MVRYTKLQKFSKKIKKIFFLYFKQDIFLKELFIYPTDSLHGLGGQISESFKNKLLSLKKRTNSVFSRMYSFKKISFFLKKKYLYAKKIILKVPATILFKGCSFGIRGPKNMLCRRVVKFMGPIYSTSINISSYAPITCFKELVSSDQFKKIYCIWDERLYGHPSFLIDFSKKMIHVR